MIGIISSTILATSIFLLFLLPGAIVLKIFWSSDRGHLQASNIYSYLVWGTPVSIFIYFAAVRISLAGWALSFTQMLGCNPIVVPNFFSLPSDCHEFVYSYFCPCVYFLLFVTLLSVTFGFCTRELITKWNLDVRYETLRYRNDWHYKLTARVKDYSEKRLSYKSYKKKVAQAKIAGQDPPEKEPNKHHYVMGDFVCDVGGTLIFYRGVIVDFKLKDDTLDYLVLNPVQRTKFHRKKDILPAGSIKMSGSINSKIHMTAQFEPESEHSHDTEVLHATYIDIPGTMMIFKFDEIKNINIDYLPFNV